MTTRNLGLTLRFALLGLGLLLFAVADNHAINQSAVDLTQNGRADTLFTDLDDDGLADIVQFDYDEDNLLDNGFLDSDQDGRYDRFWSDRKEDGLIGHGELTKMPREVRDQVANSPMPSPQGVVINPTDANDNGIVERVTIDLNDDGVFDSLYADDDENGCFEFCIIYRPHPGVGLGFDREILSDEDGNGFYDLRVLDVGGDETVDRTDKLHEPAFPVYKYGGPF